ncbi:hypothetical protein [Streptomyces achromogenes]|uniref:hypothetical protein n=1 Tax=Streptomyces achromogenes TaxID=67255 RepID=UPI0036F7D229
MADYSSVKRESHEVEIFRLELDDEELRDLRADPNAFLRRTIEDKGHTVNRVMIDVRALQGDGGCPGHWELVHLLNPPGYQSTWTMWCVPDP